MLSIESFHTARSSSILNSPFIAVATEGGSTIRSEQPSVILYRYTLIKPGASGKKLPTGVSRVARVKGPRRQVGVGLISPSRVGLWPSAICATRGWGGSPYSNAAEVSHHNRFFEASRRGDSLIIYWNRTHIKCGEHAPCDCGLRGQNAPLPASVVTLKEVKGKSR